MEELSQIHFTQVNIISLALSVILLLAIPIAFWAFWYRRYKKKLKWIYLIGGMLGFLFSVRVLELGVHYICLIMDNPVSRMINSHTMIYVIYGISMAGLFEEVGRYLILKYLLKKDHSRENAVYYGIGHGGIEVWAVILPAIILELVIAVMSLTQDAQSVYTALHITKQTSSQALPVFMAASHYQFVSMFVNVLERIMTMFVHISLTVIVFQSIIKFKKQYLLYGIGLHMLVDLFPALYQRGAVSLVVSEIGLVILTICIIVIAYRIYQKQDMNNIN
ncbi:YhfC family intramembrane metalloprotease [Sharpea azabuensis]|uniref:YhfC family intramembrane metalloprotease n=1 Tax=Sharpea azabuensis TaxID=322505 RepID=UPI00156B5794|nr:YhfC family glutamic-type intramembrane protease [Sharpea azabuensis]